MLGSCPVFWLRARREWSEGPVVRSEGRAFLSTEARTQYRILNFDGRLRIRSTGECGLLTRTGPFSTWQSESTCGHLFHQRSDTAGHTAGHHSVRDVRVVLNHPGMIWHSWTR